MEKIWASIDQLRIEVVRLQYTSASKDIQIETTKLANEYMRNKVDRNKRKRKALQKDLEEWKRRATQAEKRIDILETERDTIRTEFHQLQSETSRLNRKFASDEEKRRKLRPSFSVLNRSIGPDDKEAAEAMEELKTLLTV